MSGKPLTYFKWFVDKAAVLKESLTETQVGIVFNAIMDYVRDGTIVEVPQELDILVKMYRMDVDNARTAYEKTSAVRAASGAKGGKAKAAKTTQQASVAAEIAVSDTQSSTRSPASFVIPTQKQLKEIIEEVIFDGYIDDDFDVNSYAVSLFYKELKDASWTIDNVPLTSKDDLAAVLISKFAGNSQFECSWMYRHFCLIFSYFNGLRDASGTSYAGYLIHDLWHDCFSKDSNRFNICDQKYIRPTDALLAFLPRYAEENELELSEEQISGFSKYIARTQI